MRVSLCIGATRVAKWNALSTRNTIQGCYARPVIDSTVIISSSKITSTIDSPPPTIRQKSYDIDHVHNTKKGLDQSTLTKRPDVSSQQDKTGSSWTQAWHANRGTFSSEHRPPFLCAFADKISPIRKASAWLHNYNDWKELCHSLPLG